MSIITKLHKIGPIYDIGGLLLLLLRAKDKITGKEEARNYLYKVLESANPKDYPRLISDLYVVNCGGGGYIDLENPITFNEKIQWLKIYDSTPLKAKLADKYLVREWIEENIGEEYLIPLLGVWDSFDEIDFDKLPDAFVLKCNHGSGMNLIVTNKNKLNKDAAKEQFDEWMKINYAFIGLELHYMDILPKIIAEEYITDESGYELKDYKIFCFSGEPKIIDVDFNRFTSHTRNLYTTDWEFIDESIGYPNDKNRIIEKPSQLNKMLELSKILSESFPFVRVDFYVINSKIYFGEMTFTSDNGEAKFSSYELAKQMGEWIKLN